MEKEPKRRCCCGGRAAAGGVATSEELFQLINSIDWTQKKPVVTREATGDH